MTTTNIPLFPLRTVLFPGGPLPLRVFEPRYLDMISRCMKESAPFGVVLIADGPEVGGVDTTTTHGVGTLANIVDWYQGTDGLLGITAAGTDRFRVESLDRQGDGLITGQVKLLAPEPTLALPAEFSAWPTILKAVIDDLGKLYETVDKKYDDASWIGFRFAEILPLEPHLRQQCLELLDPLERLEFLRPVLRQMRDVQTQ